MHGRDGTCASCSNTFVAFVCKKKLAKIYKHCQYVACMQTWGFLYAAGVLCSSITLAEAIEIWRLLTISFE